MMFAICHPSISKEAQIGLSLRILCGFGIDEIANAFLTNKETVNKRLFRAKEKLKSEKVKIEFPSENEINKRLETVLTTLYLFFNEGYYSESSDKVLRKDLCFEAMRLTHLLSENELTNQPNVYALLSLMYFHASRFDARNDENGEIILYKDQNEALWNYDLISKGVFFFKEASKTNKLTKYHLEAGIAYWHTVKEDTKEKWENILHLHNHLLYVEYSPIAALNRTFAVSKVKGKIAAITETEKIQLHENHLYHALLGELYTEVDNEKALKHLKNALALTKSHSDKNLISKKIIFLENLMPF